MKKTQSIVVALLLTLTLGASAALVVEETFTYSDGPVTNGNGGTGWAAAAAWDAGNTDGSTRRFNVLGNEAIYNGAGTGATYIEQNRGFASAITVDAGETVTLQFKLILNETFAGRGCGIYLTNGGVNQYFIGKQVNQNVTLSAGMGSTDIIYADFGNKGTKTLTLTMTRVGANTSMVLADGTTTLAAYTHTGAFTFDGISLAGYHASTTSNGIDDISIDVTTGGTLPVDGALEWTGAGIGDATSNPTNWLSTATGTYPTETPAAGLALVYTGGVVITNAAACTGGLDVDVNTLVIDGVASQMTGGAVSGSSTIDITDASLQKSWVTGGAAVTLNDGAILEVTGGGNPLNGVTIDLNSLTAELNFTAETYTDFASEHSSKVTAFGDVLQFGSDPLVAEPGDNALATDFNAPLGVQITAIPEVPVPGALVWTGAATTNWTGNVTNWLSTATGTYPTETPDEGGLTGLALTYTGGVVITNAAACNGQLYVGVNPLVIDGVASQMTGGAVSGSSAIDITDASLQKLWVTGGAAVTLNAGAILEVTGAGNPLNGVTIDLNSLTAELNFAAETYTAFTSEHINKVTSFGAALEFGADPFVAEPGDNALATDFNAPNGVQITALGDLGPDPIGDIGIGYAAGAGMVLSWDTTLGQTYAVQTNENLISPNWGVYDTIVGDGGGVVVTAAVDQATLFYKVTSD